MGALAAAASAMVAGFIGGRTNDQRLILAARNGALVVAGLVVLAALSLIAAFLSQDFTVKYVADHSSRAMPAQFVVAAFYSGQEGSLLYWALAVSVLGALAIWRQQD